MPRSVYVTVKTVPKKGSTALGKNQPWFIDGDLPPRQTLAPQHGRDTCTFNGAKLPPRATHSTQDGEGCLCNLVFRLSLDAVKGDVKDVREPQPKRRAVVSVARVLDEVGGAQFFSASTMS